jgi:hypothetical protein
VILGLLPLAPPISGRAGDDCPWLVIESTPPSVEQAVIRKIGRIARANLWVFRTSNLSKDFTYR